MAKTFAYSLVSPEAELASGEAAQIITPGTEGEFGALAHHAALMSTLENGLLRVLDGEGGERRFLIRGGFAEIADGGMTILTEEAADLDAVDADWLTAALEEAQADRQPSDRRAWLEDVRRLSNSAR